ncbi:MAG: hypothetical protein NTX78_06220 [Rhodoluna sp.]|nr:hypothetical protein [Rhodoluna sp.]
MKSPKLGAAISIALFSVYLLLLTNWAIAMITIGSLLGIVMGALVLTFPLLGAYAIYRELRFGLRAEAMGKELEANNEWPVFQLVLRPSGRPTRESADENFKLYSKLAEQNPTDWKSCFALSLAYDACGDRPRARKAMAEAMTLHRR